MSAIPFVIATILVVSACIITSQSGEYFTYFGIEWKHSNLHNFLFWFGVLIFFVFGVDYGSSYKTNNKVTTIYRNKQ